MSFSVYVVCFAAAVIIVGVILMCLGKGGSGQEKTREMKELKVDAVEKKKEKTVVKEDPAVTEAKKELYQYMNQCIKKMFHHFRKEKWEQLAYVGAPSDKVKEQYDKILDTLPEPSKKIVNGLFACLMLEEEVKEEEEETAKIEEIETYAETETGILKAQTENKIETEIKTGVQIEGTVKETAAEETEIDVQEENVSETKPDGEPDADVLTKDRKKPEKKKRKRTGIVTDSDNLKKWFLNVMLPFYPVYYKELDGVRYSSLLNKETLDLFHRLTGKRFRMGYKNRYSTGIVSYEWTKNVYRVYDKTGECLCDASFKDGKVENGYALIKVKNDGNKDWELYKKGSWKDGVFEEGTLQYVYKKTCG